MDDDFGNRRGANTGGDLGTEDEALLERLGEPPLDPTGNAIWANNAAAAWAAIVQRRRSLPFEERLQLTMRCLDRVGVTTGKATTAKEIADLKARAGLEKAKKPNADRLVPVANGSARRATSRAVGRSAARPLPDLPPENDGGDAADGGRPVGPEPDKTGVH